MDSEAINPVKGTDIRPTKAPASSGKSAVSTPVQNANPTPDDTVSLSPAAKEALKTSEPTPVAVEGPKNETADLNIDKSRKIQVTDRNEVVLKIVDNKTREVVKQIPSEEEVELKRALRENAENITNENNPTEDLI
jgi:FlaG protein